jgi:RHS repeat-associated protein
MPDYLFNAKELDEENGMYYYSARYYNPPTFISRDPLFEAKPWMSGYAYCGNNPVNKIDPTGMSDEPVYDIEGNHIGNTKEGFTGTVLIYSGADNIDFSTMTAEEAQQQEGVDTYDNQRSNLSNDAKSKIWTNIASHFEGLRVYDEVFTMNDLVNNEIGFQSSNSASWTSRWGLGTGKGSITGSDGYNYETTVENIASSIIVHEFYSHVKKDNRNEMKSHRLAYKNVINYKTLWNKTTDSYKNFNLDKLQRYTKKETGRDQVDPPYRYSYNKYYGKSFHLETFEEDIINSISIFQINNTKEDLTKIHLYHQNVDSLLIEYWNSTRDTKYMDYLISFNNDNKIIIRSGRSIQNYPSIKITIDSLDIIKSFVTYINKFYIDKTEKIILEKRKTNIVVSSDCPNINVIGYRNGIKVFDNHVRITEEDDEYRIIFNPEFLKFHELIKLLVKYIDKDLELKK